MKWINRFINPTLSDILDRWYDTHRLNIAYSTAYGYKCAIKRIKEYFGEDIKIRSLTSDILQDYILYLRYQKSLSNTTIYNHLKAFSLSLNYAVSQGFIKFNPLDGVEKPSSRGKVEIVPYTEEDMKKLLSQDFIAWVKDAVIIAYHTGMRLGEIFGLKWTDINFEQSFIMVQRSLSRGGCKAVIKTTKTSCGVRRIDIDRYLLSYLVSLKTMSNSVYVFSMPNGQYRIPWNMAAKVKEMCILAGVAPRDFHTLRHTHATILLAHGVHPKIVQERLGHSDIKITMGTYSYVTPTIQREAVNIFDTAVVPVVHIIALAKDPALNAA